MNFITRKETSAAKITPAEFQKVKKRFSGRSKKIHFMVATHRKCKNTYILDNLLKK